MGRSEVILALALLWAQASHAGPSTVQARRAAILQRSDHAVSVRKLARITPHYPDDCTGFVRWSYAAAGMEVFPDTARPGENGVGAIHRRARSLKALHWRRPRPGDLVFFRETYDRNRDGLRNDGLTHVGIVEAVDGRGIVTYTHRTRQGVVRSRMHPGRPTWFQRNGVVWNDYVRGKQRTSRAYLSGELFAGYASAAAYRR